MVSTFPTEQKNRTVIVDVIRGFALIGVLIANFTSYVNQQTPQPVLDSISSSFDRSLIHINAVFFEWKFFTLFSILFGYGFGLILESLEEKKINPNTFFLKRMFWLFLFGCIHTIFWWADVLHLYALSGIVLLSIMTLHSACGCTPIQYSAKGRPSLLAMFNNAGIKFFHPSHNVLLNPSTEQRRCHPG